MSRFHRQTHNRAWGRLRKLVLERDRHRCKDCGKSGRLECHHVLDTYRRAEVTISGNLANIMPGLPYQNPRPKGQPRGKRLATDGWGAYRCFVAQSWHRVLPGRAS